MRSIRVRTFITLAAIAALAGVSPSPATIEGKSALLGVPDLRIVGWTIDDTLAGNGDGGLHPGETAVLQIHLSNFGNETARGVAGTLTEVTDHPEVDILDKVATWPDLAGTGAPGSTAAPHFSIRVATTRPCQWEIPLRLDLVAQGGYFASREFTLRLVDPQVTELPGEGRPFLYGAVAGEEFGTAVASGDIDGDGFDDLIVGSPAGDGPSGARPDAGQVAVLYGGPARRTDQDLLATPSESFVIGGATAGDFTGAAVASGDLDADGFDDVIFGVPNATYVVTNAGRLYILYGKAARYSDIDLMTTVEPNLVYWAGRTGANEAGNAVAAGDINKDGFDDLVIGVYGSEGPGLTRTDAGEVDVVYGGPTRVSNGSILDPVLYENVSIIYGATFLDQFGSAVAAGDFDGDGFDDVLAGAWRALSGPADDRSLAGEAVIVYGGPGFLPDFDLAASPAEVTWLYGADGIDRCGDSIAAGDLDGDGRVEVIVGCGEADGPANARDAAGEVALVYGEPGRPTAIDLASPPDNVRFIYGADPSDWNGTFVHAADLDGDGYDELLVAAPLGAGRGNTGFLAGEIALIRGGPGRLPNIDLVTPPSDLESIYGESGDGLPLSDLLLLSVPLVGSTPIGSGDLDGDGFNDLIIGVGFGDGPDDMRVDGGEVAIIPGAPRSRYRHDADPFAFIDATIGSDLGLGCDDCSATIPIGFEFDYFGRKYDLVTVGSNGYLSFGGNGDLPLPFCPPNSATPNNTVAVLWDDWNPAAGGAVYSLLEGTAPNRRVTIEWAGVPLFPMVGDATFEVTLFESSDQILMQYQDTVVGDIVSDNGGTAVVGLENAVGVGGVPASCFSPTVVDLSSRRFRRFASPTTVFSEDAESGMGGFTATGLWHREDLCAPSARGGAFSWYYGIAGGVCDYDTGLAHNGTLTSPPIPALPQDAALTFWHRRQTESSPTADQSFVEAEGDGGGFATLAQISDVRDAWSSADDFLPADPINGTFASVDLSSFAGQTLDFRFRFDTVDNSANSFLGWMIDDIEVKACPVFVQSGGSFAAARATAQPDTICETSTGTVDAVGSYCAACSAPLTYQWREEGAPIPGATGIGHNIPAGHAIGSFDYTVDIACPTSAACADQSDPASVTVVQMPVEVGPTLMLNLDPTGTHLEFHWTDATASSDYVVFSSIDPSVAFTGVTGSATSGASGLTAPNPSEPLLFFLVAGRNPACGVGPQRSP